MILFQEEDYFKANIAETEDAKSLMVTDQYSISIWWFCCFGNMCVLFPPLALEKTGQQVTVKEI